MVIEKLLDINDAEVWLELLVPMDIHSLDFLAD